MKKTSYAIVCLSFLALVSLVLVIAGVTQKHTEEPLNGPSESDRLSCDLFDSSDPQWANPCPATGDSDEDLEAAKRLWANPRWGTSCRLAYEAVRWRECECAHGYLEFVKSDYGRKHGHLLSESELIETINNAAQPEHLFFDIRIDSLPGRVASCLNIQKLFEGNKNTGFRVQQTYDVETKGFRQTEMILSNDLTGASRAILLRPKSGEAENLVICLPGHSQSPEDFRDSYLGGFEGSDRLAFLIVSWRAMCADAVEETVSKTLLMHGHDMLGLQAWEAHLWRQYWTNHGYEKFALMGHSGGSVIASVLFWLDSGFSAIVVDEAAGQFIGGEAFLHDKSPCLWNLRHYIYDLEKTGRDMIRVPYNYSKDGSSEKVLGQVKSFLSEKFLK